MASPTDPVSKAAPATSAVRGENPLGFMDRLSECVYIYRPSPAAKTAEHQLPPPAAPGQSKPPKLILLNTWMDAQPAHIAKYLSVYINDSAKLFGTPAGSPPPPILLIRSYQRMIFWESHASRAVLPAVTVLQEILGDDLIDGGGSSTSDIPLLVHTFSNGGVTMLSYLFRSLEALRDSAHPDRRFCLPRHVSVMDSCPARFFYHISISAFAVPLARKPLLVRLVGMAALHILLSASLLRWSIHRWWKGGVRTIPPPTPDRVALTVPYAETIHQDLVWDMANDRNGPNRHQVRRVYIYSREDVMVAASEVEANAADAKANGFNVLPLELFVGSAHVAHARADPERYWGIVTRIWQGP